MFLNAPTPPPPDHRKSRLKRAYDRFLRLHGTPHEIALGFALGLVVGFTPFMGAHMFMAVVVATVFRCSKAAAAMVVWFSNPLTAPVVYIPTYIVGNWCMGGGGYAAMVEKLRHMEPASWLSAVPDLLWPLVIGGIVVSVPFSIAGYFVMYKLVSRFQDFRRAARNRKPKTEPTDVHQGTGFPLNTQKPARPAIGYCAVMKIHSAGSADRLSQPDCVPPN